MIVIRVELWSAITGRCTELARMTVCNDGGASLSNPNKGDYDVATMRGRDAETLQRAMVDHTHTRSGKVRNHNRQAEHVWNLVAKALQVMGYGHRAQRTVAATEDWTV